MALSDVTKQLRCAHGKSDTFPNETHAWTGHLFRKHRPDTGIDKGRKKICIYIVSGEGSELPKVTVVSEEAESELEQKLGCS